MLVKPRIKLCHNWLTMLFNKITLLEQPQILFTTTCGYVYSTKVLNKMKKKTLTLQQESRSRAHTKKMERIEGENLNGNNDNPPTALKLNRLEEKT
jgi:hypothetical protein